ncbi:hypothetical protein ACH5RR_022410 [Cinchona calisaya]|uniref:Uncharacterized protein n=1 Tax=Cinchona calisaya TaxID=153742 RepID=A0ABD2ZCN7_9GENT
MDDLNIKILSRELIKPSHPTPEKLQSCKLSLFDQLAPPTYIRIILCYSITTDVDTRAQKAERLKSSLSESLTKFYPLAGRIVEDEFSIDCNDHGVEYLEAEVDGDLADFIDKGFEIKQLDQFMPDHAADADFSIRPLAAFRVNFFGCGGVAIGLSISHKIADTSSVVSFLNGWANTSRLGIDKLPISPSFDVSSFFPVSEYCKVNLLKLLLNLGPKIVSRRFLFQEAKISKFRTIFMDAFPVSGNSSINGQPSRVTLVNAVIWKALINTSQAKHGNLRPSLLCPAIGLRGKTVVPLTERSFGNFWFPVGAHYEGKASKLELHELVFILDKAVKRTAENIKKASRDEIFMMATEAFKKMVDEKLINNEVDTFICTSWSRFPLNEVDFGWGQPCKVSSLKRPYEMFTLLDSKNGDIEALVCLNENDMPRFEHDPDVLALTYSSDN